MREKCTAIVLAAGAGKRMQSNVAKQYLMLGEKPVLWYALHTFEESSRIEDIILVVSKGEISYCQSEIVEKYGFKKVCAIIEGGAERYLSVWNALSLLKDQGQQYVFIHDGARPFVNEKMIEEAYEQVVLHGACVVGMPVKDTIKIADSLDFAVNTPERKSLWAVQTPQVFRFDLVWEAYTRLMERLKETDLSVTDDAMVVETMLKKTVKLVPGDYENIKITTPEDMVIAEALLQAKKS